jgi:hypothetical protein
MCAKGGGPGQGDIVHYPLLSEFKLLSAQNILRGSLLWVLYHLDNSLRL